MAGKLFFDLVKEIQICPITVLAHLRFGDEFEGGGVDAVALSAFIGGAVIKDVAKVRVGGCRAHFGAGNPEFFVHVFIDGVSADGLRKTWPSSA